MPFINRFPANIKPYKKHYRKKNSDKAKLRQRLYNNSKWKKLRESYLMYNPTCEMCKQENRITSATDVHHINSPFDDGLTDSERLGRLLDSTNLMALCQSCHGRLHFNQQQKNINNISTFWN